jgi:hypothetical protein
MAKYGRIVNGKVVELYNQKPMWFTDDKKLLTDEQLIANNVYPINMRELSSFDSRKEIIQYRSKNDLLIDEENKVIYNYIYKISKTVDEVYKEKVDDVNNIRNSQIYSDVPYRFPDTEYATEEDTSYIQVRDEVDIRNIQVNGIEALKDIAEQNTTNVHYFRDFEDVTHILTASQILAMASHVKNVGQQIYIVSWTHKYALEQIYSNESLTDEQKIDALINYNTNTDWPVQPKPVEEPEVPE